MRKIKPIMLIILDGFGFSSEESYNAIAQANTPNLDNWLKIYPNKVILAAGAHVGLLDGYIGNSEVGHLTIGSGRVIKQPVAFIHDAIQDNSFFLNKTLTRSLKSIKNGSNRLHIMGLLSDSGVHSHIEHLFAFLQAAKKEGIKEVYVHVFLDGRDVGPRTAEQYLHMLDKFMVTEGVGTLGSIHGRFYAMDRDNNWERIEKTYRVLTGNISSENRLFCKKHLRGCPCWKDLLKRSYKEGVSDEFVLPTLIDKNSAIKAGDGIIFFNFRPDRARQLTAAFMDPDFDLFPISQEVVYFVTPVRYSDNLQTHVMFEKKPVKNTLLDLLAKNGKTVFVIAETEKYAHVTYFFSGGREGKLENEIRVLVPSLQLKSYAEAPKMSAELITSAVIESLKNDPKDFYIINYANADMVGHSGDFEATIKAIECLDHELKRLYDIVIKKMDGTIYITGDHGNAEQMFDVHTGQPHTAHTANPVPFIFIQKDLANSNRELPITQLSDIAPFILKHM